MKKLLEFVAERLGYVYDCYGTKNLRVSFGVKGRKL
jgi:uncharacterized protein (DUF2164 family)